MDYAVGSLAELISGVKADKKIKIVEKEFKPVKKKVKTAKISKTLQKDTESVKNNPPAAVEKDIKKSKFKKNENKRKLVEKNDDNNSFRTSPNNESKIGSNKLNAANRIKNRINHETKNSSEYKDKTIFIGNVPINVKKIKVLKHFKKYGPIHSCRIRGIPVADMNTSKKVAAIKNEFHPERTSVNAYIRFKNAEDAKKAEAENGVLFFGHHIRVETCESTEKPDESKAIFVGNLPFKAEEEELWDLFKTCGPISHVRIVRDGRTRISKGFAYVNFKDSDSVQLALEMGKTVFKDRELRISPCDSNRAKKIKKPRTNSNQDYENTDLPKKRKFNKSTNGGFTGIKSTDKKKKKKISKTLSDKKKLIEKLTAPKVGKPTENPS